MRPIWHEFPDDECGNFYQSQRIKVSSSIFLKRVILDKFWREPADPVLQFHLLAAVFALLSFGVGEYMYKKIQPRILILGMKYHHENNVKSQ